MADDIRAENCEDNKSESDFKNLSPAALRALAEAEQRRLSQDKQAAPINEIGGRGGQDPVRFGDWEVKGRAIDF